MIKRTVWDIDIHVSELYYSTGWWQLNHFFFTRIPGEMIQFDEHIFQTGWFNHQLVTH